MSAKLAGLAGGVDIKRLAGIWGGLVRLGGLVRFSGSATVYHDTGGIKGILGNNRELGHTWRRSGEFGETFEIWSIFEIWGRILGRSSPTPSILFGLSYKWKTYRKQGLTRIRWQGHRDLVVYERFGVL